MGKFKNILFVLTSFILTIVTGLYITLGGFSPVDRFTPQVRTVNVENVSSLTYNEKAYQELEKFQEYEISSSTENENILNFEGIRNFKVSDLSNLNFVSESLSTEDISVNYNLECNRETTEVSAKITYKQEDAVLNSSEIHITHIDYDETTNEAILFFADGSSINTADLYESETINDCSFIISAATAAIATKIVYVVVYVLVAVIVYYVIGWFFAWLGKSINYTYQPRQVQKTVTYYAPAIQINGIRFETKAKTKAEIEALPKQKNGTDLYYLAFASGIAYDEKIIDNVLEEDGLYIGSPIDFSTACNIMTNPTYTKVTRDGITYSYVASIYSHDESSIVTVLNQPNIGFSSSTPLTSPEYHNGGLYHYHPADIFNVDIPLLKNGKTVTKKYRPHAFFLNPDISWWLSYEN